MNTKLVHSSFLVAAFLAGAPGGPVSLRGQDPAEPASPAADAVRALFEADRAFCRETEASGLDGWLSWFAEEATILPEGKPPVSGIEAVAEHYSGLAGFPPAGFAWEPKTGGIASSGDLGFTSGTYDVAGKKEAGVYLTVWTREPDGAWKVLSDCGGRLDVLERVPGLSGAPLELASEALFTWTSKAADLCCMAGAWTAKDDGERSVRGKLLRVWRKAEDGSWTSVAVIGFVDP